MYLTFLKTLVGHNTHKHEIFYPLRKRTDSLCSQKPMFKTAATFKSSAGH